MTATTLRVLHPGGFTTTQDTGRPGWAHYGVARSGAADRAAARLANRLVGNDEGTAVLETLAGGLTLLAVGDAVLAVTGAVGDVRVQGRLEGRGVALQVLDGQRLEVGPLQDGLRSYVAVRGGLAVEPVLGSRSYDQLGAIGPPPLTAGDTLGVGELGRRPPWWEPVPLPRVERALDLIPGPRWDWLAPGGWTTLLARPWSVQPASNRTGVRLAGEPVTRRAGELPSEGMLPGFVQLPPDGQPIMLGPDCGVTGGYPVVAVVPDGHLDRLAQLAPGDVIRFRGASTTGPGGIARSDLT